MISYLVAGGSGAGAQPTVLLIHGSGVSARSWTNQLRGLGQVLRVLAIDLPGHGDSEAISEARLEAYADAARGALDALGTGPVFAAGHSLGGAVAQLFAARHPDAVTGLVLVSTCARLPESNGFLESYYRYLPAPIRKLLFFSMTKKILFAPTAPREAILLGMEEIRSCRPETILTDLAVARSMDLQDVARGIRVPTLILCGGRDKLTAPALSQELSQLIPGSRLLILERAGHMLPLEAPEWVNQAILDFVRSVARCEVGPLSFLRRVVKRSILRRLIDTGRTLFGRG
ncbi:MAG: alpha/beta fold hydrolase [Candidatus Methylomirabilota bacterium]